jgi:uncharacterized membrane protein
MSIEERLTRLEQRLTVLEGLMRQVAGREGPAGTAPDVAEPGRVAAPAVSTAPAASATSAPPQAMRPTTPEPPGAPPAAAAPSPSPRPASAAPRRPFLDAEEWIGQKGLLAVGVVALILAAGYLLKLAFDRDWITQSMRCLGGVVAGAIIGGLGWRLVSRYRTYGAALVGCGAAIIYLSVWAAAKLYGILPPTPGIAGLALTALSLAVIAYAIDVEALASTAVLGAFFAPILLGRDHANADLLLIYLGSIGVALGWVASRKRWRLTAALVALSYFGLGWNGVTAARPSGALAYTIVGGAGGIWLGLRERWWETRFLAFWGGWALLATVDPRLGVHWPTLAGGLLLAAPVWMLGLRRTDSGVPALASEPGQGEWSLGELLYFFTTPFLVGWAVGRALPDMGLREPGLDALIVGIAYLAAGYLRRRPPFALVGTMALVWGTLDRWSDLTAPVMLLGLALAWAVLDHWLTRTDGRWYAVITLVIALAHLLETDASRRSVIDPAFVDHWALVLWLAIAATTALAAGLWRREPAGDGVRLTVAGLWMTAGALVLFGVTAEIQRYFRQAGLAPGTAQLAGGLAVSAWWLIFAAALVVVGLRRGLRPARLGGLAVAGLAVAKVLLIDLASLDALYRVGSVFILGLVSLLLAYLYNREAPGSGV